MGGWGVNPLLLVREGDNEFCEQICKQNKKDQMAHDVTFVFASNVVIVTNKVLKDMTDAINDAGDDAKHEHVVK